ncbi:MAG: TRAP transporter small permease [Burkholderiaceae bacterium]|jgi:TRAP-type C4-dicarboxylate transport system permease small subunit|nr:TRAP transporter small permease [Burkholderiaceae bacterium]
MKALAAFDTFVNRALAAVAGLALIAMMLFTVADMVLRAFGHPVAGSYEVIGWLSAVAMALALGYAQLHKGHVAIDLVVQQLRPRTRAVVEMLTALASLLLFAAVAWYVAGYGVVLHRSGSLSETLKAIVYPWVYVVAIGCGGLALALLTDFLRALARVFVKGEG